jgi:glutamine---fructose-6-phosphate transaminase (isomerizing)
MPSPLQGEVVCPARSASRADSQGTQCPDSPLVPPPLRGEPLTLNAQRSTSALGQPLTRNAERLTPGVASARVLDGLRRLEYRGYDSAGIAAPHDGALAVRKDVGHIAQVDALHDLAGLGGDVAIGHTRWATHGGVTQANAHPHTDSAGRVAVVHNGIIENFRALRAELESQGIIFASETDTEVIPHLISLALQDGHPRLEDAVRAVCARLEGSYAFVAMYAGEPGTMVGVRRDNPLVVGYGDDGAYLASDVLAFAPHAGRMASLADGEVVVVTPQGVRFVAADGTVVEKESRVVENIWAETSLSGCAHYMLKEIMEQPLCVERTVYQDEMALMGVAMELLKARSVVFTACGTSRHASLIGRLLFSQVAGKMSEVVMGSEFEYFHHSADRQTLVIAVSQSGETADILEGVKLAKREGARVLSVVNRPKSVLGDMSDHVVLLNCGPEIGVAATKSFLSQVCIFYMLAHAMVNRLPESMYALQRASAKVEELLANTNHSLERLMERFKEARDFYFIGRGMNFPLAMEGALKMKEISYVHAEGMPAGELKHGTIALIEEGTPVVVICPHDGSFEATISNAMEAKARGAYIIGVSDVENAVYDTWVPLPEVPALQYPLVIAPPLQLMAYYAAVVRGRDPDKPRNLAKSVTVK